MQRGRILGIVTLLMAFAFAGNSANAAECQSECFNKPIKPRWSNGYERAGCPQDISCFARPSILKHEDGYYVGGGAPCNKGDCRCCDEGTWGWDFFGTLERKKVALNWYHGEKYQGGTGAYKTDGPHCKLGH
jgi:hypothetical protein